MTYEAWRSSYQSSEAAARAAWDECQRLRGLLLRQYNADKALYEQAHDCSRDEHESALIDHDAVHIAVRHALEDAGVIPRLADDGRLYAMMSQAKAPEFTKAAIHEISEMLGTQQEQDHEPQ